jgi:formylglycine-generating enzyme required for sulfatase activity
VFSNGKWDTVKAVNWRHDVHGNVINSTIKDLPVVHVSWIDAKSYCEWLSKKERAKYRLPTEAEWEYAAKGGKLSKGFLFSGSNSPDEVGWYDSVSNFDIHPVGKKIPNELGIHDMSGNVFEWCLDKFDKGYYKNSPPANPVNETSGDKRVARGGSWSLGKEYGKNTSRQRFSEDVTGGNIGFRVCRVNK